MTLLLLACAALQALVPTTDAPASRTATEEETLYVGEQRCRSGAWTVACPSCTPAWSRTVTFDCRGVTNAEKWSVELLDQVLVEEGGLDDVRSGARAGEDWNITNKRE